MLSKDSKKISFFSGLIASAVNTVIWMQHFEYGKQNETTAERTLEEEKYSADSH